MGFIFNKPALVGGLIHELMCRGAEAQYSIEKSKIVPDEFVVVIYDSKGEYGFERGFKEYIVRRFEILVRADWKNYYTPIDKLSEYGYFAIWNICVEATKNN